MQQSITDCCWQDIKRNHAKLLRANQHLRYMWIPHTDRVVVVTNNPHRQASSQTSLLILPGLLC